MCCNPHISVFIFCYALYAVAANILRCRVYLSDLTPGTFQEMNDVYAGYFGDSPPARATVGAQLLGFDVEIECVAALPAKPI